MLVDFLGIPLDKWPKELQLLLDPVNNSGLLRAARAQVTVMEPYPGDPNYNGPPWGRFPLRPLRVRPAAGGPAIFPCWHTQEERQ